MASADPLIISADPTLTAEIMMKTGLDDYELTQLERGFCAKVRADVVFGPIFAARISDWGLPLERMAAIWSSVAVIRGRYHGASVLAHVGLQAEWTHVEHWPTLIRKTGTEGGAADVVERAERIARSLYMAVKDARPRTFPALIKGFRHDQTDASTRSR